jgi:hypothetical protein
MSKEFSVITIPLLREVSHMNQVSESRRAANIIFPGVPVLRFDVPPSH